EVRDKDKIATFAGNVHVVQGDTTLTCQSLLVYYDQNGTPPAAGSPHATLPGAAGNQQQIRRLEAKGGVVVTQKDQTATGANGVYDMKSNTVTLNGNVVVTQGPQVIRGEKLTVDLTTGVSHVEAGKSSSGRVEALIQPGGQRDPRSPGVPK